MRAVTNQTGAPHWDAHGRLIPPGGIIALDLREIPEDDAHEATEVAPGGDKSSTDPAASTDVQAKAGSAPQPEPKGGKSSGK